MTTAGHAQTSRFELVAVLGEGSGGVVHRAIDRETGETVALKVLRAPSAANVTRLRNEFRVVQGLRHRNVVEIRDLVQEGGEWCLSMEFVDGVDFLRYVAPTPEGTARFDEGRLRQALSQLASALGALHRSGRTHRDIKPSNVLVTHAGRVVVLDFGLMQDANTVGGRVDDGISGTVDYMAPEQVTAEDVGPAADWYAVGVILYRVFTGRLPFDGDPNAVMEAKVVGARPDIATFGEEVPEDLAQLCCALLEPDPTLRVAGDTVLARTGARELPSDRPSPGSTPCVGRDEELAALHSAYADVLAGRAVTVLIQGESGVGKSVFTRRFAEELLSRKATPLILFDRCYEREAATFKAFGAIIDGLVRHLAGMPEERVEGLVPEGAGLLPTMFPELGRVEAIARRRDVSSSEPSETRRRAFLAFRELVSKIAATVPLVLIVDDLQWADPDSADLLTELLRPPRAPVMLLVCSSRSASASGRPAAAAALPSDTRDVTLERLGLAASATLVAALFEQRGRVPDAMALLPLIEEAGGHPMFLAELVRQRMRSSAAVAPSLRLDDALRERVSALSAGPRRLLEFVCLAGLAMPQMTMGDAAGLSADELSGALSMLRSEHLVQTGGSRRQDPVEPYHDRIREAVVASLTPTGLRECHLQLALAIEQSTSPDPEMLAFHWLEADNTARAAENAVVAARRAAAVLAFDRAARLYGIALRFATPGSRAATETQLLLAETLTSSGRWAEAAEHWLAAADESSAEQAISLRRKGAELLLASGHFDRGATLLFALMRSLDLFVPSSPIIIVLGVLLTRLLLRLRGLNYTRREACTIPLQELARIDTLASAGLGLAMNDNIRASYFMGRGALLALAVGEPHRVAHAFSMVASFTAASGKKGCANAKKLVAAAEAEAERLKTPVSLGMAYQSGAWPHYFTGEFAAAKRSLLVAETIYRQQCVGVTWLLNTCRGTLARTLMSLGDLEELEERLGPWLREADALGDVYTATNLRAGPLVLVRLVADRPDLAAGDLVWVQERLPRARFLIQHFYYRDAQVMLALYEGRPESALAILDESSRALRRSLLLRIASIRTMTADQEGRAALAVAAAIPARRDSLLVRVERAARDLDLEGLDPADGHAAMLRAGSARLLGDNARAGALARKAQGSFERAGMAVHAAAALYAQRTLLPDEGERRNEGLLALDGIHDRLRFLGMLLPGWGICPGDSALLKSIP